MVSIFKAIRPSKNFRPVLIFGILALLLAIPTLTGCAAFNKKSTLAPVAVVNVSTTSTATQIVVDFSRYDDVENTVTPNSTGILETPQGSIPTSTRVLILQPPVATPEPAATDTVLPTDTPQPTETVTPLPSDTATSEPPSPTHTIPPATFTPAEPPQATATSIPKPPTPTPALPTVAEVPPHELTWVVTDHRVTALFRNETGDIYFAGPKETEGLGDPFHAEAAVWKKPANGQPIQLTPFIYNEIGGIFVYNGHIYFNEIGSLRRIQDNNEMQEGEVVLHYPNLSTIYMHVNHALAGYNLNGQDVLLMAVGSRLDSDYDAPQHRSGIQPPYYEDFPTGRIIYASLAWLEQTHNYEVEYDKPGEVSEFARGMRNPWSMAVGSVGSGIQIYAADNDPTFTPEKYDNNPENSGDEVNLIVQGKNYGHPYYYAGQEPEPGYVKPLAVFPDGSVPSGVAVAGGKLFVSLHDANMITKVDPAKHTWTPVLKDIMAFNLFGYGNFLYIADWSGIRVIDARDL